MPRRLGTESGMGRDTRCSLATVEQVGEWSRRLDGGGWTQEEVATVFGCAAETIRDLDVFRTAPRWCVSSRTVFETDS